MTDVSSEIVAFVHMNDASVHRMRVRVSARSTSKVLGHITWSRNYRQYSFYPASRGVFTPSALAPIQAQCKAMMDEWQRTRGMLSVKESCI